MRKDSFKKNSRKNVEFLGIWGERILKTVPKTSLTNLFKKNSQKMLVFDIGEGVFKTSFLFGGAGTHDEISFQKACFSW